MRIRLRHLCIILLSVFLFSCSDPTPIAAEKSAYVGLWVAADRHISIFAIGRLEYREKLGFGLHNRVESNFEFDGNTLRTAMFVSFVVEKPPYQERGEWKMIMDGVLYRRVGSPRHYGRSNNWPDGVK